jgi:alpha-1,6-mannosyltransferase
MADDRTPKAVTARTGEGAVRRAYAPTVLAAEPTAKTSMVRGPKSRWLTPYGALATFVVAVSIAIAVRGPWVGDFWLHAAVVDRLSEDLLHPGNPLVDADTPSPYYTPYTFALGLFAGVTGWSGITVLAIAGPLNVALLLVGVRRFCAVLNPSRWTGVVSVTLMLLLWGVETWAWSGFLSLWALPLTLSYPSTFAAGVMLLLWADLVRALDGTTILRWAVVAGWAGLLVTSHSFTALNAMLGAIALVVWRWRSALQQIRGLMAATVAAIAFALAWPYYSLLDVLGSTPLDAIHATLFAEPLVRMGLALVALPALSLRWRRDRRDPLVLMSALATGVLLAGWLTERYSFGRVWPLAMLAAQLALAVELIEARPGVGRRFRRWWGPAVAAACAVGLWTGAGNALWALPDGGPAEALRARFGSVTPYPRYDWIRDQIAPGDVVLTDDPRLRRVLPAYGARTVAPAWPDPLLADEPARVQATETFFAEDTTAAERRALTDRYGVRWVLDAPGGWEARDDPGWRTVTIGPGGDRLVHVA